MMPGALWSDWGHAPHPSLPDIKTLHLPCGHPVVTVAATFRAHPPLRLGQKSLPKGTLMFLLSHLKARTTLSLFSGRPTAERIADPVKANSLVELMGVEVLPVIAPRKRCRTAGPKMLGKRRVEVGRETTQCCTRLVFPCLTSPSRTPWTEVWRSTWPAPQRLVQEMQED